MSSPVPAFTKGHPYNGRWYRQPGSSTEAPSVTEIISDALSKPALLMWAPRLVAEYVVLNPEFELNRQLLSPEQMVDFLKTLPTRARDSAGERGTDVHEILHAIVEGRPIVDLMSAEAEEYVKAGQKFLEEWRPKIIATEATVYGQGYAGTFDMLAELNGQMWLLDWKTSKGVYGSFALQLNAYANCQTYFTFDGDNPAMHHMPAIDRLGVVHLRPDGGYDLYPIAFNDEVYQAFLSLIPVYHFIKREALWVERPIPPPDFDGFDVEVYEWVKNRARALCGQVQELVENWPAGVPTFGRHDKGIELMTAANLDAVDLILGELEYRHKIVMPAHPHEHTRESALEAADLGVVIDIGPDKPAREQILLTAFGTREAAFAAVKAAAKRIGVKVPRSFNGSLEHREAVTEALHSTLLINNEQLTGEQS